MCILKNPNIDVKDKEVPEHRFCEDSKRNIYYPKSDLTEKECTNIAVGQFIDVMRPELPPYYLCGEHVWLNRVFGNWWY